MAAHVHQSQRHAPHAGEEVREMFRPFESTDMHGGGTITAAAMHFGGNAFRVSPGRSGRPFGFRIAPPALASFAHQLKAGASMRTAAEDAGFSPTTGYKFIRIINKAASARGLPPVRELRQGFAGWNKGIHMSDAAKARVSAAGVKRYREQPLEDFKKLSPHSKTVRCDQTGEVFRSIAAAARGINAACGNLSRHIKREAGYLTVKGYTFTEVVPE